MLPQFIVAAIFVDTLVADMLITCLQGKKSCLQELIELFRNAIVNLLSLHAFNQLRTYLSNGHQFSNLNVLVIGPKLAKT